MTAQDWLTYVATQDYATTEFIEGRLYDFWSPKYSAWNIYHERYNPPPTVHPVPSPSQQMYRVSLPPEIQQYISEVSGGNCSTIDCVGLTLDAVGLAGSTLTLASPSCTFATVGCAAIGQGMATVSGIGGATWTLYNRMYTDGASNEDALVVTATYIIGATSPQAGAISAAFQVMYDIFIAPYH